MFGRVLFPTDFSAYANAVFACLPELQPAGLREVVLAGIIREGDVPFPETVNRDSMERVRWSMEENLNVARMALEGHGLRVITRIEYGPPAMSIVRVAEEERVELIVMGAQGKTVAQELLLGSVAHAVVRQSTLPVLILKFTVVREMGHVNCNRVCTDLLARVLHPTDFSDCAQAAFQIVKRLKAAGTRQVTVLHVQDERVMEQRTPDQLVAFDRIDTERLASLCNALVLFGLRATPLLKHGIPSRETLEVADEVEPCLIVLGSQGRTAMQEALTGSTLETVVRLCRQPVLVVRHDSSLNGSMHGQEGRER
ncbi:MAG: universal stress protein [Chloroflexi bacterium]|nr:universal stress protein [Chloroflexota bacterium]